METNKSPIYLDCNATTPVEPEVAEVVMNYISEEFGTEGSRTHSFGARARKAVQAARDQVANVVGAKRDEVIFSSGATESNNLAILGLEKYAEESGMRHIVTTTIEHKAVLEPIERLEQRGFEVTKVPVDESGQVLAKDVKDAVRDDTVLVSVMQAN